MADSDMINDLMQPLAYPEKFKKVTLAQTHISNVFIGDNFVYKIKKPVNFGFLDFSTLEKRKFYCNQEVILNSRFSSDIYLGVYPVTFDGAQYKINGKGEIIDYAVKMKRLSDEDLLKTRVKKGIVTDLDISRIGTTIARFHKQSKSSPEIEKFGRYESIKLNTDENFIQTKDFIDKSVSKDQYHTLKNWTDAFYRNNKDLFKKRVLKGKIRDCHGDLHMEHICLTDPIILFDCIEFNERFRYIDVLSEIAFLLMDLEYHDARTLSDKLCKSYLENSDEKTDETVYDLINFYKVYRSYVRGKVTSFILNDTTISEEKKSNAIDKAKKYFTLATTYISK